MLEQFAEQVKEVGQNVVDAWAGQIFDLSDAYNLREPLRYVIGGLIPEGSLSIVYGPPGSLKSMLMGDASMSVASGTSWLGREVTQGPALWLDFDNGKRRSHERFEALARARNLPENTPFYYVSMPTPWLNAGNLPDIEALEKRIIDRGVIFVVIDNLALISPSADENSDDMVLVMSHLRLLAERTGAAIIVIHHQRKSTGSNTRAGESLRGHSSIESALDLALRVDREPDGNFITIQSTKTRDCDVPVFGCEFRYEHKPDSTELLTACFVKINVEDTTSDKAIEKTLISIVQAQPLINQKNLTEGAKAALQVGVNRIRLMLKNLVKKRCLKIKDGAHGAKLYIIE
jgi:hypothetical protein